jgi:hypothetical protein
MVEATKISRFTIKTLLLLMVLIAFGCGILKHLSTRASQSHRMASRLNHFYREYMTQLKNRLRSEHGHSVVSINGSGWGSEPSIGFSSGSWTILVQVGAMNGDKAILSNENAIDVSIVYLSTLIGTEQVKVTANSQDSSRIAKDVYGKLQVRLKDIPEQVKLQLEIEEKQEKRPYKSEP